MQPGDEAGKDACVALERGLEVDAWVLDEQSRERLDPRAERDRLVLVAATVENRERPRAIRELGSEPRLADAALADDQHEGSLPGLRAVEQLPQACDRCVAADERRDRGLCKSL